MIEQAIDNLIKLAPESTAFGNRVRPLARDETLPACSFDVTNPSEQLYIDGSVGLTTASIAITVYTDTFKQAKTIAKSIKDTITGYSGVVEGVKILLSELGGMSDDYDNDAKFYSTELTFNLTYEG